MLALAGYPLGLSFRFLEPKAEAPVNPLGEVIRADYDDRDALARFADGLDVVTYEFENVPVEAARFLQESVPVYPPPAALEMAQDRLVEKESFRELGIGTAPYRPVDSPEDLADALEELGTPAVLKTRRWGYDGKGQELIREPDQAGSAWETLGHRGSLILEGFVEFSRELSVLAARGRDGDARFYPLVQNEHRQGILRLSRAPAPEVSDALQGRAEDYARRVLDRLEYVGVVAIELFQVEGELLANEMAPRVHNSGHWTIDGATCSQFENHLRAVCGLPLGPPRCLGHAAMLNLLGDVPASADILRIDGAHLHLYDKSPRPGRKVGHVNVQAADAGGARSILDRLEPVVQTSENI